MKIKSVIFDLGGVILRTKDAVPVDALALQLGMTRNALEEIVYNSPSAKAAMIGEISEHEHWMHVLDALDVPRSQLINFIGAFVAGARMDSDLLAFISKLRVRYQTGLLSNAWSSARHWVDVLYGGLESFDEVVFSAEVGLAKPEPAIYHLILKRLESAVSESVFIDDTFRNVEVARSLGMYAIQFQTASQTKHDVIKLLDSFAE